jgi:hypothetical protein
MCDEFFVMMPRGNRAWDVHNSYMANLLAIASSKRPRHMANSPGVLAAEWMVGAVALQDCGGTTITANAARRCDGTTTAERTDFGSSHCRRVSIEVTRANPPPLAIVKLPGLARAALRRSASVRLR